MREAAMGERCRSFFPLPLWERVAPHEGRRRVRGILPLGKLCENVLQYGGRLLQHIIIPVARSSKTFCDQDRVSRRVALGRCVLTTIDFDDEALLEANEIENKALKGDLATKLEERKASVAQQAPHRSLGVGGLAPHLLCEVADALGGRPMVWR